jgi:hypothetical protein
MPSKRTAQFEVRLSDAEALESWMEKSFDDCVFEYNSLPALIGTEFETEWSFPMEFELVDGHLEARTHLEAVWLVNPRSGGKITDDDVDTLWRFSGFPLNN